VLVLGFATVIFFGTALLRLPAAVVEGPPLSLVDALFTATSAVCVTGLVVVDTATTFSTFGELVIMVLIQIGGLGIMSMSTFIALLLGRRISFRERLLLRESLGITGLAGIVRLLRYVLLVTFIAESLGALLLFLLFLDRYPPGQALYLGVFHSISAFNNAGFDLFSTSLTGFTEHLGVNLVVMTLIIVGGLGFPVIVELFHWLRARRNGKRFPLSLHTKLTLTVTGVLILLGSLLIFLVEADNPATLGQLSPRGKLLGALFTAITPRTAGFSTLPTENLRSLTLFSLLFFMWVGGSPSSTAGGIKTTTLGTLVAALWGIISGKEEAQVFRRRLTRDIVDRSWTLAMISVLIIMVGTGLLLFTEGQQLLETLFEVTSAFGTVGLSTGLTPALTTAGRVVIIITMFIGRVGPLTFAAAVAQRQRHKLRVRHPEERIMVG